MAFLFFLKRNKTIIFSTRKARRGTERSGERRRPYAPYASAARAGQGAEATPAPDPSHATAREPKLLLAVHLHAPKRRGSVFGSRAFSL